MGRPARIQFPGACYYVILRGNNRQDIFLSNQDRRRFLSLLKGYKERYDLLVYAYCLMNNSVDLLLETRRPNLSRVMQGFNTAYTKYFNRAHNMTGHVFQGRYRALLVEKERWLLEMTCVVHLSPVRAALKEKPWRYIWCSAPAYVESGLREPVVDTEPVLRLFAKSRLKQSVMYLHHLKERMRAGANTAYPARGGVVGSPEYAASVTRGAACEGEPAGSVETARRILAETAAARGIDEEKLLGRSQWREVSAARKEAVARIWREARLGVTEIARLFHRTPSAISQFLRALETAQARS